MPGDDPITDQTTATPGTETAMLNTYVPVQYSRRPGMYFLGGLLL